VPALDRHPQNRFSLGEGGLLPHGDVLFVSPIAKKTHFGYLAT